MTQEQVKKMPHGLYRVYWKEGGYSLASMGSCYDGSRWICPCNWTHSDLSYPKVATTMVWRKIERLEEVLVNSNYGAENGESI